MQWYTLPNEPLPSSALNKYLCYNYRPTYSYNYILTYSYYYNHILTYSYNYILIIISCTFTLIVQSYHSLLAPINLDSIQINRLQ